MPDQVVPPDVAQVVLVVDDNLRFVAHVWRYLTQAFQFGETMLRGVRSGHPAWSMISADRRVCVEWYNPKAVIDDDARDGCDQGEGDNERDPRLSGCLAAFEARVAQLREHQVGGCGPWAIVDVHGLGDECAWAEFAKRFESAAGPEARKRLFVVSSYCGQVVSADGTCRQVWPKTPASLMEIRSRLMAGERTQVPQAADDEVDILVTGAGFEMAGLETGPGVIGVPRTADLLREIPGMVARKDHAFPLPGDRTLANHMAEAARVGDLDRYCEVWFREVARAESSPIEAAMREARLRGRLRDVLLRYDVGHLLQALDAARLGLDVWLSTNYTRFADRAIGYTAAHSEEHAERDGGLGRWDIAGTPIHAAALQRDAALGAPRTGRGVRRRLLVKLHGDIGQTLSMAFASSDKMSVSSLHVRPELDRMYLFASEQILSVLSCVNRCRWHVVGHSLQDKPLLGLIGRVVERSHGVAHHFRVVDPKLEESAVEARLAPVLGPRKPSTRVMSMTAVEYMSWLSRFGLASTASAIEHARRQSQPPPREGPGESMRVARGRIPPDAKVPADLSAELDPAQGPLPTAGTAVSSGGT